MTENLKRCRGAQKIHLKYFEGVKEFITSNLKDAKYSELKLRLDDLIKRKTDFLKNQGIIEELDELELESDIRATVDDIYYEARSALEDRVLELKSKIKPTVPAVEELAFIPKLPEIILTNFSGDIKGWKNFIESFKSHVHNNPKLTILTKFQYLKNSITGTAAKTIDSLDFTAENYEAALELLYERYDKPVFLAEEHIRSLFKIKSLETPSPEKLHSLLDDFNSHLRSLKTLGRPVDHWDDLIVYLISSKLDVETRSKWRESFPITALPTFTDISAFIKNRCHKLQSEKIGSITPSSSSGKTNNQIKHKSQIRSSFQTSKLYSCIFCNKIGHSIMRCHKFHALSAKDRVVKVSEFNLCSNCLRQSHTLDKCNSKDLCKFCKENHHTLLHVGLEKTSSLQSNATNSSSSSSQNKNSSSLKSIDNSLTTTVSNSSKYVFLSTALVKIIDKYNSEITVKALLDSGSQINLISKSLSSRLGLKLLPSNTSIRGIGNSLDISSLNSANITIKSAINNYSANIEVQVLPKISGKQPSIEFDPNRFKIPSNIKLADPRFFQPSSIDLLIGNELIHEIQSVGQINLGSELPTLQNTLLGWIICGSTIIHSHNESNCNLIEVDYSSNDLNEILQKFWFIEDLDNPITSTFEDECEIHFRENTMRDENGRFVVRLPFSHSISSLGDSEFIARKRFLNLEAKLNKNISLRNSYNDFMHDYLLLGHMEPVIQIEPLHYYLPHHCVMKPDSSSTKLRVVFDGSAKTSSGLSLNQILMNGPVVQNDLFTILIRFRAHAFAISADITKMYRQIKLHPDDHRFQYIFWRFNDAEVLQTFKLNTVTYGTTPASFLATRCLYELSNEFSKTYPEACSSIRSDFYVDDILFGSNSIENLIELRIQISNILKSAGFSLHKWCTNNTKSLTDIPENSKETKILIDDKMYIKTLGLFWESEEDHFRINVKIPKHSNKPITKRLIVSEIARSFDPIGLISPIIVQGKLIIQKLWELKLDWDEALPQEIVTKWEKLRIEMESLSDLKIPRHIFNYNTLPKNIEIHAFSDASERAYGAAIYVRSIINEDQVIMHLLCSKSRIAPLKKISLPRLELCAALLASQVIEKLKPNLNIIVDDFHYWTDSMIVLHWLNSPPNRWKTFVANRVAKIQISESIKNWRHIQSEHNPADFVSRGSKPKHLISSTLWWQGPQFLHNFTDSWKKPFSSTGEDIPELASTKNSFVVQDNDSIFDRLERSRNNFLKIQRVFSYVNRFIKNIKENTKNNIRREISESLFQDNAIQRVHSIPSLCVQETKYALNLMLRAVQIESFSTIYYGLLNSKNYSVRESKFKSLSLFLCNDKLLRVGGRLENSSQTYSSKHPILLPSNHCITFTIVNYIHREHLHVGPQGLLAAVRQKYWPINGRRIVKRVYRQCVLCSRARPTLMKQVMADLPHERVNQSFPFLYTGVDYCGPFYVHYSIRGKVPTKAFLAVFVCFATKAVHLELASNLTTSSFIGALKRFISTRGIPAKIFSDNGTNFVGTNNDLHQLYQLLKDEKLNQQLQQLCSPKEIEWSFIPPGSPHFGGLHEAAVKSAKQHLKKMLYNAHLTYEEFSTLIKQVESILNSRPLTANDDLDPITPGHFLIHRPLTAIPEYPENNINLSIQDKWKLSRTIFHDFWRKWSSDYLKELQYRHKWHHKQPNLNIGSIVILKEDNLPPLQWKLGKVIDIHPGSDQHVRVATVKTNTGIYKRAIQKLALLPIDVEQKTVQGAEDVHLHHQN